MIAAGALDESYDVAVVGAGPAGLAAAATCAQSGLRCGLFDEQQQPGGQIYRGITNSPFARGATLGDDYWRGEALVRAALDTGAHYASGATVWGLLRPNEIMVSIDGVTRQIRAGRIILATGAIERPFPIQGWTLPGVMTAGAAQILLKTSALAPRGRTVLAGCGPLLWLLAWQYLNAGVRLDAILDTTASANWKGALRHAAAFATSPYLAKGLRLMLAVHRAVPVFRGVVEIEAEGRDRVEAVSCRTRRGRVERLPADTLLLHQGVVPNVNLALSANVAHDWSDTQLCFVPRVDQNGATDVPHIAIAGDGAGISGAEAAEARGRLAGIAAVRAFTGKHLLADEERVAQRSLHKYQRGRSFLDLLYQPAADFRRPRGDVVVCRCEEITARQILDTVTLGCPGPFSSYSTPSWISNHTTLAMRCATAHAAPLLSILGCSRANRLPKKFSFERIAAQAT